jgi:hypothetical protein
MPTTFQWVTPEAVTSALFTELNALADSTSDTTGFSAVSAEISNETGLFQYINLEFVLATQGAARSAGGFVAVYIIYALNGTTYGSDTDKAYTEQLTAFQFDAATTARRITKTNLPIPPLDFKLQVLNDTGQALAGGANALNYRRHNEQGV